MKVNEQLVDLPNGEYKALWTSNHMEILIPEKKSITITTTIGVRGINIKMDIDVIEGSVYTKKRDG
jgi:hypothetical protein